MIDNLKGSPQQNTLGTTLRDLTKTLRENLQHFQVSQSGLFQTYISKHGCHDNYTLKDCTTDTKHGTSLKCYGPNDDLL